MRRKLPKIIVTGGAGFMGSAFTRLLAKANAGPIVVDTLSYAADLKRLSEVKGKYRFYKADIQDQSAIEAILKKEKPFAIVNFAAETHVDRSIKDSAPFIDTNVKGTQVLIDAARKFRIKRFVHLSTDEVYGEVVRGAFHEECFLQPNSPYAASKAAADLLIKSYIRTHNFPVIIIRPCNNYGPWQYPEKLIPRSILKVMMNEKIPLYASGKNVREWLYVEDCARGVLAILLKGAIQEVYNLGSDQARENIAVVKLLLRVMSAPKDGFEFVKDRPGHDFRYRLNSRKVSSSVGWASQVKLEEGIQRTALWAIAHKAWLFSKLEDVKKLYKGG